MLEQEFLDEILARPPFGVITSPPSDGASAIVTLDDGEEFLVTVVKLQEGNE